MIHINSIKEFNKYIYSSHKLAMVYFYKNKEWCDSLNTKLFNIFKDNCNGNINILLVNVDNVPDIINETNLTTVPIIHLYKDSFMFQEIYCTFNNLEDIIKSLIN